MVNRLNRRSGCNKGADRLNRNNPEVPEECKVADHNNNPEVPHGCKVADHNNSPEVSAVPADGDHPVQCRAINLPAGE
jgi:hypothetical protein